MFDLASFKYVFNHPYPVSFSMKNVHRIVFHIFSNRYYNCPK